MRRADLTHLIALAAGCAVLAACSDSTSPRVARATLAADAAAPKRHHQLGQQGRHQLPAGQRAGQHDLPAIDNFGNTGWWYCPGQTSASLYLATDPLIPAPR